MARRRSALPLLVLTAVASGVAVVSLVACGGRDRPSTTATAESSASPAPGDQGTGASSAPVATGDSGVVSPTSDSAVTSASASEAPSSASPPVAASKKPSINECFALQGKVLAKVTPSREAIVRRHAACKGNDDCVGAPGGGCFSSCGGTAINKRGEEELQAASSAITDACKPWRDVCAGVIPIPTCGPRNVACVGGKCVMKPSP